MTCKDRKINSRDELVDVSWPLNVNKTLYFEFLFKIESVIFLFYNHFQLFSCVGKTTFLCRTITEYVQGCQAKRVL